MFEYKKQKYETTNTGRFKDFLGDTLRLIRECLGMDDKLFREVLAGMPEYAIELKQLKSSQMPRKSLENSPIYNRISIPTEHKQDREKIIAEANFLLLFLEMLDQEQDNNTPIKIGKNISKIEALFMLLGVRHFSVNEFIDMTMADYLFNVERIKDRTKHTHYFMAVKAFILELPEMNNIKSFFGGDKYTNTQNFLAWAVDNSFLKEVTRKPKDEKTGIPLTRFKIYKDTLPIFLEKLTKPISIRGLTVKSDEFTEGNYTKNNKDKLGVGGSTTKKEITLLLQTDWWKCQPYEIREKISKK